MIRNITVFCGSSPGNNPTYCETAFKLGHFLAEQGIGLVYGGAKVGMMGAVADGALSRNGRVTGVLPVFLQAKEIAHEGLTDLILVESMHERKLKMHELSDGVIALPGGFGTLEELFEMLTWGQLGLHMKPVALLNVNGFYDGLLNLIETMVSSELLKASNRDMLVVNESIAALLNQMRQYQPPSQPKWIIKETRTNA